MKHKPAVFGLLFLLFTALWFALSNHSLPVIRLHDDQIDIQKLNNAIAKTILETGYGFRVELVESTIKELHDRIVTGDIDVTLEMWKENNLAWYEKAVAENRIRDLGAIYTGGRQYWIIPKWYAREKQITHVLQMQQHWRDFSNPEDPSKGIFFNCIFGWSCRDINRTKLRAYGLDRYYNTVSPTSPEALKSIYESALARKLPVFGYYWEPNAIIASDEWFPLKEPPYSQETWEEIIAFTDQPGPAPPDRACAFQEDKIHKLASVRFASRAPEAVAVLSKMHMDTWLFTEILFNKPGRKADASYFDRRARTFLQGFPEVWEKWVTPEAAQNISRAVQQPQAAVE